MKTIKFFHPEETLTYFIDRCFCKVIFSGQQHQLLIEIESNDDLDHVEGDAIQNRFPHVIMSVDDFPVDFQNIEELPGKTVKIPHCYVEVENEDEEVDEYYYTNVNFSDNDYESDQNTLVFSKNTAGNLCLKWRGEVQDFTEQSDDYIPFELECVFSEENFDEPY
ncbi:MAG: hypothetical protein WDA08_08150 [Weeksellaceae bacterium]